MDRRKFERYGYSFRVLYKKASSFFGMREAYTGDISRGGLRLNLKKIVPTGAILRLMIFNPFLSQPIAAKVRVVWVKRNQHGPKCVAGVSFLHMTWTDSDNLLAGVG